MIKRIVFFILTIFITTTLIYPQTGWQPVDNGSGEEDLITVFFTSAKRGFIAGDNGFFAVTRDGGKTWAKQFIYTDANINEIYFRNDDDGYLVAGKNLFVTDDKGRSWREIVIFRREEFSGGTPEFLSVRFADKKRGVIVGSVLNSVGQVIDSLVMRTADGGQTWQRVLVPFKRELFHLDFVDSKRGWIVGDQGMILASTDGGSTWQVQQTPTDEALFNVDFRDKKNGFAVGSNGIILRTETGGENWLKIETNFPAANYLRVDFASDKNGWIVGHKGTILRSSDEGKTWVKQDSRTMKSLYGLYITKKFGWAVGADGTMIKYEY